MYLRFDVGVPAYPAPRAKNRNEPRGRIPRSATIRGATSSSSGTFDETRGPQVEDEFRPAGQDEEKEQSYRQPHAIPLILHSCSRLFISAFVRYRFHHRHRTHRGTGVQSFTVGLSRESSRQWKSVRKWKLPVESSLLSITRRQFLGPRIALSKFDSVLIFPIVLAINSESTMDESLRRNTRD